MFLMGSLRESEKMSHDGPAIGRPQPQDVEKSVIQSCPGRQAQNSPACMAGLGHHQDLSLIHI